MKNSPSNSQHVLTEKYIHHLLNFNERPKSVYLFVQSIGISEIEFYGNFASFEGIESQIFCDFFEQSLLRLETEAETNPKSDLTRLYHLFFNTLTENRSLIQIILKGHKKLQALKILRELGNHYRKYVESLGIKPKDLGIRQVEELMQRSVTEISWAQLIFVLNFWLNDDSVSFEKTHQLIDKSMETGFDMLQSSPVESLFELGKFIVNETFKTK